MTGEKAAIPTLRNQEGPPGYEFTEVYFLTDEAWEQEELLFNDYKLDIIDEFETGEYTWQKIEDEENPTYMKVDESGDRELASQEEWAGASAHRKSEDFEPHVYEEPGAYITLRIENEEHKIDWPTEKGISELRNAAMDEYSDYVLPEQFRGRRYDGDNVIKGQEVIETDSEELLWAEMRFDGFGITCTGRPSPKGDKINDKPYLVAMSFQEKPPEIEPDPLEYFFHETAASDVSEEEMDELLRDVSTYLQNN